MRITVPAQRIRHQRAAAPARRNLYFAYGSNLNVEQMLRRCPRAEALAPLYLQHTELTFRGVADLVARRGSEAAGGLWEITEQCERSLDAFEGVSSRYYVRRFFTVRIGDQLRDVLTYQMAAHRGIMPPSEAYLQTIRDGYDDFGLDVGLLRSALSRSWAEKDVTRSIEDRYSRRGRPPLARRVPAADPTIPAFYLTEQDLREAGAE